MKEKKYIKISLSTALLIIAVIIIIILCMYIVLNKNNINKEYNNISLSQNNNETKNEIIENSTGKNTITQSNLNNYNTDYDKIIKEYTFDYENDDLETKGINLTQLPGEFYNIEAITKEFRENNNIKNYKDFEFDLDGDGIIDKVTLRNIIIEDNTPYARNEYVLEYNGEIIYENWEGFGKVGIVDLDNTDDLLEIWVYDDGPSDDPTYSFYRKVENKIIKLGTFDIDLEFLVDGKGKIVSADRSLPWVTPQVYDCYYTIENNTLKKHILDFSYNKDFKYTANAGGFFTNDLENLKKFKEDNEYYSDTDALITKGEKYNIKKLDENLKFKIIEFIEKENEYDVYDLKVVLSDGTEGYLIHLYERFYIFD